MSRAHKANAEHDLTFEEAARLLKALGHPLRLRLVCGLCHEPNNLTRIVATLNAPASTVALHLGVLRRAGILAERKSGAVVSFEVKDEKARRVLQTLCHPGQSVPMNWDWESLAESLDLSTEPAEPRPRRRTAKPRVHA